MALPSLTLRNTKGSALTYTELDNNFTNLSTATVKVAVGSTTTSLSLNDTLTLSAGSNITLSANSSTKTVTITGSAGGITDIVQDTTPQLGGNLDVQTYSIVSTANQNINITPDGTGDVNLAGVEVRIGKQNAGGALTTWGTSDLSLTTNEGANSGSITIQDGVNGNIILSPNGTGNVVLDGQNWPQTPGTSGQYLTTNGSNQTAWSSLNTATATTVGGIKVGSNLSITSDGTLSATAAYTLTTATSTALGGIKVGSNLTITGDGTLSGAAPYTLTTATSAALGGVKIGSGLTAAGDGTISVSAVPATGVTSINFGSTGLTPATATTGTVTVGGVLSVGAGGTNTSEIPVNGQILIAGNSSYLPRFLTAGTGITITTATNSITIAATAVGGSVYEGGNISSALTPNASSGTIHMYTLTNSISINTVTNLATGSTMSLVLSQDSTGNRVATWPNSFYFAGATATSYLSTSSGAIDKLDITRVRSNMYLCTLDKLYTVANPSVTAGNTLVLLHMDNSTTDSSGYGNTWTLGGTGAFTTTQSKFGSYSFDDVAQSASNTTNEDILYSTNANFEIGTGDFTIEAWVYNTSNSGGYYHPIFDCRPGTQASSKDGFIIWYGGSGTLEFGFRGDGTSYESKFGGTVSTNAWIHIAACRTGTTIYAFINGSRVINTTVTKTYDIGFNDSWSYRSTARAAVGQFLSETVPGTSHYVDEVRLSKGLRYANGTTITVPTNPFVND